MNCADPSNSVKSSIITIFLVSPPSRVAPLHAQKLNKIRISRLLNDWLPSWILHSWNSLGLVAPTHLSNAPTIHKILEKLHNLAISVLTTHFLVKTDIPHHNTQKKDLNFFCHKSPKNFLEYERVLNVFYPHILNIAKFQSARPHPRRIRPHRHHRTEYRTCYCSTRPKPRQEGVQDKK